MNRCNVPGFSVAFARNGQFAYRAGFGFADSANREGMSADHLFRIASLSKPITAVAIFSLIEKGQLRLDAPVFGEDALLGFDYAKTYPEPLRKITLTHLLTHTCGGWEKGQGDPMFLNPMMNHQELISWTLVHQPLKHPPGTHYGYSNFGYCLVGRILEKITGRSYADFVQEEVLAKCGIRDMRLGANTLADRAAGEVIYYGQNGQKPYHINVARMDSHAGWIATPSDLVKFVTHVDGLTPPNILAADTLKTMVAPCPVNPHYAYGWCVSKDGSYWHNGSLAGVTTIVVRSPSGLCWAGFVNTRNDGTRAGLSPVMWTIARTGPGWE
jgi:CubicO group peptidase (beta-lactamase class C family)